MEKQTSVIKVAALGDSVANGVAANTVVGGIGWRLMAQHLLVLLFMTVNNSYVWWMKLILAKTRFKSWKKANRAFVIQIMDKILADAEYSWLIGTQSWCLIPRLKRLFNCQIELTTQCRLGNSWHNYLNGDIALPADQDIVIIQLGANEFFEGRYFDKPEEFANRIRKGVLEKLLEINPRALIYVTHVPNLAYILTDPANEYTKTYRIFRKFGPSVAWYHRNFWHWSALGCRLSNKTDRQSEFFQERLLSHARFHGALKKICTDLNQGFSGQIRTLDEMFSFDWYHASNEHLLSADGTHPSKNAHRLGAYHFSKVLAQEYSLLHKTTIANADSVPMLAVRRELLTRITALIPMNQKVGWFSAVSVPIAGQFKPNIIRCNQQETVIDFRPREIFLDKIECSTKLSNLTLNDWMAQGELAQAGSLNNNLIRGFYLGALAFGAENLLTSWIQHITAKYALTVKIKSVDVKFHKIARHRVKFKLAAENWQYESNINTLRKQALNQQVTIAVFDQTEETLLSFFTIVLEISSAVCALPASYVNSNQQGFFATSCDIVAGSQAGYFFEKYGHLPHFSFVSLQGTFAEDVCWDKIPKITALTTAPKLEKAVHDAIFNAYEDKFVEQPFFASSPNEELKKFYGRIRYSSPANRFVEIPIVFKDGARVVADYRVTMAVKRKKSSLN